MSIAHFFPGPGAYFSTADSIPEEHDDLNSDSAMTHSLLFICLIWISFHSFKNNTPSVYLTYLLLFREMLSALWSLNGSFEGLLKQTTVP